MTQKDLVREVLNQVQIQIDNISSFEIVYVDGEKNRFVINYKIRKPWETPETSGEDDDE